MAWIVDAYNALSAGHALPEWVEDVGAMGLAGLMHRAGMDRRGATVVADGSPKPEDREPIEVGGVRVVFSGPGGDADSIIESLIEECHSPRGLTVVSNDRRLIAAAKRKRANSMSSEAFMRKLAGQLRREAGRKRGLDRAIEGQVDGGADYWMKRMWAEDTAGEASDAGDAGGAGGSGGVSRAGGVDDETGRRLDSEADRWMREFGFEGDGGDTSR